MSEKYYLMNDQYEFVEVDLEAYQHPPDEYIDNRISVRSNSDGSRFVDVQCYNVGPWDLVEFFKSLS